MNDNIDDWLNSLGLDSSPSSPPPPSVPADEPQQPQEPALPGPTQPISLEDLNDILAENGFQETEYDEAEEVMDESDGEEEDADTEEYNENGGEGRDLEAVRSVNDEDYPIVNPDTEASQETVDAFNMLADTMSSEPSEPQPLIPPNSPTLLINDGTSRFSGAEWYNEIQKARVILAGCGGIGSYVCYNLARMNIATLCLYDDDIVEQANMSGQLYGVQDIGKAKVDAMVGMICNYTTMRNVYAIQQKFTTDSEAGDIMICGFDNMAARKTFFDAWYSHMLSYTSTEERAKCLYLDGRLSIDTLQVFCVTGDNDWAMDEYYNKYLFADTEADATVCSMKQTTYLACMIGSVIVNLFTNWVANSLNPIIPYDLPFFTEYDAQNMIFKTIK